MDSFEWNKVFGGILGAVLFIVALNLVVSGVMAPEKSDKPGMTVAVVEDHGGSTEPAAAAGPPDWGTVLPAADLAAGENTHKKCLTCHDFTKGGPNKIGPNLWGIVGNKHAHAPDYTYSAAMQAVQGNWDYDALDTFLTNPKATVPGTKMAFAGLSRVQERVNLIAWLRTQSDAPVAIPPAKPAAETPAPAAPVTPAEGETPESQTQNPPAGETPQPGTPAPAAAPAVPAPTTPAPAPAQH